MCTWLQTRVAWARGEGGVDGVLYGVVCVQREHERVSERARHGRKHRHWKERDRERALIDLVLSGWLKRRPLAGFFRRVNQQKSRGYTGDTHAKYSLHEFCWRSCTEYLLGLKDTFMVRRRNGRDFLHRVHVRLCIGAGCLLNAGGWGGRRGVGVC